MLEHQILATVLQIVSGPGGVASFLRRNLLGQGLNGPSLPLDVGQTDDIPIHLRRLVALRDQTCQFPGGCDQPACGCEPHHVVHRQDGGHTSLANLKDLLLVAPSRGAAPDGLAADRLPGRDQPGHQPRREGHPQPRPATRTRVTSPGRHGRRHVRCQPAWPVPNPGHATSALQSRSMTMFGMLTPSGTSSADSW